MQAECLNGLVDKQQQQNIRLPKEFLELVAEMTPRVGRQKKWHLFAAGILSFIGLPLDEQEGLLRLLRQEDHPGARYGPLIAATRAKTVQTGPVKPPAKPPDASGKPRKRRGAEEKGEGPKE